MGQKNLVLNPFSFYFSTKNYVYLYVPYKHSFYKLTKEEFKKIKELKLKEKEVKDLKEKRILVNKDYKKLFLENYQRLLGNPELKLMYLISTDYCNLRCKYCFIEGNYKTEKRNFLDIETGKKWIDYFYENLKTQNPLIIFYGGEPLLNQQVVVELIKYIRQKDKEKWTKTRIGINTNGTIFSKKLARFFKENNVTLTISLDGPKELNDKIRFLENNKGVYDVVAKNILNYHKEGVRITLSVTINKYNVPFLPQIVQFIKDNFPFINSIGFNLPLASLSYFRDYDYEEIMLNLYNAYRLAKFLGIYEDRIQRRLEPIINEIPYLKDCAGCGNQIVVSPEGLIGACHGFLGIKKYFKKLEPKFKFEEEELFKLWNSISPVNKDDCKDCPFILICGNACPYYSYLAEGSLFKKDKRYCQMMPIFIQETIKDLFYPKPKALFVDFDGVLNNIDPLVVFIRNLLETLGFYFEDRIEKLLIDYYKKESVDFDMNWNLINALKRLKKEFNLKYYIVTRRKKENVLKHLKRFNLTDLFEDIYSIDKTQKNIKKVLELTGLKVEEVIYVGDFFRWDIINFYRLGFRCIQYYAFTNKFLENDWFYNLIKYFMVLPDGKKSNEKN